jgi:Icc-related predicted phosphoesterase
MVFFFYTTDIHGSETCFIKFVNAALVYRVDALIMGGDILGKTITPIFKENNKYTSYFLGEEHSATTREQLENMIFQIRKVGSYEYITTKEEWDDLLHNKEKCDQKFLELATHSVQRWLKIAEDKLKSANVKVIINTGNDDLPQIAQVLEKSGFVIYPNEKVLNLDQDHEMISLGYSNITPWKLPGDLPESMLEEKIGALVAKLKNVKNTVFNIHIPPYGCPLDQAPKLDKDLRPIVASGGEVEMVSVGSTALKAVIEKSQPLLGLHGHIHEARGSCKIGRTLCINPGSEYQRGILNGALVKLEKGKIKFHLLVSG